MECIANGSVSKTDQPTLIHEFQSSDLQEMYCDTLTEISEYIIMVDDPDLECEKQLNWLKVLSMMKKDIIALATQ